MNTSNNWLAGKILACLINDASGALLNGKIAVRLACEQAYVKGKAPVIDTLLVSFVEGVEDAIRDLATAKGRKLKSLTAAANRGMKRQDITTAIAKARTKALHAAVAADTKHSENKLNETALQNQLKTYITAA